MRTKEQRYAENVLYRQRKAAKGIRITTFLIPVELVPEVRAYIRKRSLETLKG